MEGSDGIRLELRGDPAGLDLHGSGSHMERSDGIRLELRGDPAGLDLHGSSSRLGAPLVIHPSSEKAFRRSDEQLAEAVKCRNSFLQTQADFFKLR